jgi:hypothetical protein
MGLDMYLYRNMDQNGNVLNITPKQILKKDGFEELIARALKPATSYLQPNIKTPIAVWRKANAIHQWFISNCADDIDDCQEIDVSVEKLQQLKNTCEKILKQPTNAALMIDLLPPQSGFFFGDTDLNNPDTLDEYLDDVKYTNDLLSNELTIAKEFEKYKIPSKYNPNKLVTPIWVSYTYRASW